MPNFTPRSEIPEIFIPGLLDFMLMSGKEASSRQKMYPTSAWNGFKKQLGTLPETPAGSNFILDTEFTDLNNGKPIAIALVRFDEDPTQPTESFYVELSDTYSLNDCSDFVKTDVLPYLKRDLFEHPQDVAKNLIYQFLEQFPKPWNFWSDCPPKDNPQIEYLVRPEDYNSCSLRNLDYTLASCYVSYSRRSDEFETYNLHNALDDAKRYAITWKKLHVALDELNATDGLHP